MWDGGGLYAISPLRKPQILSAGRTFLLNLGYRWFSVTMGTGIVSILLNTLPYNGEWLYWISVVTFAFNVLLFAIGCVITALRYSLYPEIFTVMITHPVQSMFLGAFPMGFATIVNMFCFVCVPAWGEWAKNFAWGMWIFDAVLSVITALSLPFLLYATSPLQIASWPTLTASQDGPWRRNATLIHDRGLAPPHCQLCRCRIFRRNRGGCSVQSAACALDCHRFVCPVGNRTSTGHDGHGNLPTATDSA